MQSAMFCCLLSHSPLPAYLAGLHLKVPRCTLCCCCLCHLRSERIFEVWQAAESRGYSWELIRARKVDFLEEGEL